MNVEISVFVEAIIYFPISMTVPLKGLRKVEIC